MTNDAIDISDAYRSSRRNTSILCGIGIAWSTAQFELDSFTLPNIGEVSIDSTSIPIIIGAMCIYTMLRSTLEFMMQSTGARRATLAQVDYTITIYLVRFTIVALTLSAVARTWLTVFYIAAAFFLAVACFFAISFSLIYILMPLRMWIRSLSGRHSVASAAIEATAYSFLLSWLALVLLFVLMGFNIFNPFVYLGSAYAAITTPQLLTFSIACLAMLVSVYFDEKFLEMVFAYVPPMIERTYYEDGKKIYSQEANPEHPDYEELKQRMQPFVYTKVKAGEEDIPPQEQEQDPESN